MKGKRDTKKVNEFTYTLKPFYPVIEWFLSLSPYIFQK
ncbi:hypothetical protein BAOM_3084 [Peribacillus asahii]|uniref:Uncharacterized protein n=1 Tax=Peribacillus asahii TaxID=228899 RepID=A0A3Q9RPA7_9BACI|nr:hypothetical protein BAOM_3084 [Peribacillus asahii]